MTKHEAFSAFVVGSVPDTWETICPRCYAIDPGHESEFHCRYTKDMVAWRCCHQCGVCTHAEEWGKPYEGEAEVEEADE